MAPPPPQPPNPPPARPVAPPGAAGIFDGIRLMRLTCRVAALGHHGVLGSEEHNGHLMNTWEWLAALNRDETFEHRHALELIDNLTPTPAAEWESEVKHLCGLLFGSRFA